MTTKGDDSNIAPTPAAVDDASYGLVKSPITVFNPVTATAQLAKEVRDSFQDDKKKEDSLDSAASKKPAKKAISFSKLFSFADRVDHVLLSVGTLAAVVGGAIMPAFAVLFGSAIDAFSSVVLPDGTTKQIVDMPKVKDTSLLFFALGVGLWVVSYIQFALFAISAERQMRALRRASLEAILRQDIGWFDTNEPGTLATRIAGDTVVIQEGIGMKFGDLLKFLSGFVSGFVIGFIRGWLLALVMCASVPILAICMGVLMRILQKTSSQGQESYAKAGAVAEETFSSIRTVASFNGERAAATKYTELLKGAEAVLIKAGLAHAIGIGVTMAIIFLTYSLGMWWGGWLVHNNNEHIRTGGDVFSVFYAIVFGSMFLGQASPNMSALAEASGAAINVFEIINRKSLIDPLDEGGLRPATVEGHIEFKNVDFRYPSRPDVQVLRNYNLKISAGQTVALVGGSGGGKSTVISLLERFYDPEAGSVFLDQHELKSLNIGWLRRQIGLVSQEPILFAMSIKENIRFGKPEATDEEIIQAAISANADRFITEFPNGYDTQVGDKGVQISGGQKQRIAIARAVLRDPTILLLDEATSALDNESERVVQEALDKLVAMKKRTTIIIAHRLTTIRHADQIAVVSGGYIKEKGTHTELMALPNGIYRQLVSLQEAVESNPEEDEERLLDRLSSQGLHGAELAAMAKQLSLKKSSAVGQSNVGATPEDEKDAQQQSDRKFSLFQAKPQDDGYYNFKMSRVWALNKPERIYLIFAFLGAIANGFAFPSSALLITEVLNAFNLYARDMAKLYKEVSFYALMFAVLAAGSFCAMFTMTYCFRVMGEKLTTRLRDLNFRATVRQDVGWFDRDENSTGILTTRLATDTTLVKAIAGENQGRMLQNFFTLAAAMLIAFVWGSWQLTLVMLALLPLLVIGSLIQMKIFRKATTKSQTEVGESGKLATQAISYIRTVNSFNMERHLLNLYDQALDAPMREGFKKGHVGGISVGFSQLVMFGGYALVFWYGGTLIQNGTVTFNEMMKSLMAIMMAAQGLGQSAAFMGDAASAKAAASKIFEVEDRQPPVDSMADTGVQVSSLRGDIEVKNVNFAYPSRPEITILKKYSLSVKAGQTVALVGSSGGGKSTVISLLERFYDPLEGEVKIDGVDIRDYNLGSLRNQIGLVSQEPILFSGTIFENIAFGKPGSSREEVEKAAEMANAKNFILSFPDGFDTFVGDKGTQLSGGQKQRIAIARAIIKDPSILLLDEATSALDTESERIVQAALDELLLMKRRTTIVIAHRLSTIVNSDLIAFIHGGAVAELGTHTELMALNGKYARLYKEKQRH